MAETMIQERNKTQTTSKTREEVVRGLIGLVPSFGSEAGSPVDIAVPSINVIEDEHSWRSLLTEESDKAKRRGLLNEIRALINLNESAKAEGKPLGELARIESERYRKTLETAWVSLLEQNRKKESSVRWASLFFSNLQNSIKAYKGKIFAINASAEEVSSDAGLEMLGEELSRYFHRPDPRMSRGYLVIQGWPGSKKSLDRLGRVADSHRALLITDAPPYNSIEKLRTASSEGGLLESLPGVETYHRHMVLLANRGRVRRRFEGKYASEEKDVYVPLSAPWFGMYLDNIVRGFAWKPAVGYQNPIAGIDGVELDLLLRAVDGYACYSDHRLNPAIRLAQGSETVVIWGPDALSKSNGGVQIGVALNELRVIRYAEWIVNQYGLLNDLDEAQRIVKDKLSRFVVANSGANRICRAGSRVQVTADHDKRCLNIDFHLLFREVAEKAVIKLSKPVKVDENADIDVSSSQA